MSTELEVVSKAIESMNAVSMGLAALSKQYKGVLYEVGTGKGMVEARAARAAIREPRYSVEKIRKDAKAPILALGKKLDDEAKRITGELMKLEGPIDEQITTEENRKEQERLAKIAAEEKRVRDLQQRIVELRGAVTVAMRYNLTAEALGEHISDLESVPVDDTFQEMREEAEKAKADTLTTLREMQTVAAAREAEAIRLKAEREELARLRAAENERQAAAKKIADEEAAKERESLRKQREAQDAEAKAERDRIAAEEQRLAGQREQLAKEQEALRKAQEPPPAPPAAPVSRRGVAVQPPTAADLVKVLAAHYRAKPDTIIDWLRAVDWNKAEAA